VLSGANIALCEVRKAEAAHNVICERQTSVIFDTGFGLGM